MSYICDVRGPLLRDGLNEKVIGQIFESFMTCYLWSQDDRSVFSFRGVPEISWFERGWGSQASDQVYIYHV